MSKRKEFVTGWLELRVVVGIGSGMTAILPLTTKQVLEREQRYLDRGMEPPTIFRLVPVPLAEVEAQAAREARAEKGARR